MGGWSASLDVKMCGAMTASMLPEVLEIAAEENQDQQNAENVGETSQQKEVDLKPNSPVYRTKVAELQVGSDSWVW